MPTYTQAVHATVSDSKLKTILNMSVYVTVHFMFILDIPSLLFASI